MAPDGGVLFRMDVPTWLRGAALGHTTGALAVLAEAALTAAAHDHDSDVRPASLRLDTRGNWPERLQPVAAPIAVASAPMPTAPRVPAAAAATPLVAHPTVPTGPTRPTGRTAAVDDTVTTAVRPSRTERGPADDGNGAANGTGGTGGNPTPPRQPDGPQPVGVPARAATPAAVDPLLLYAQAWAPGAEADVATASRAVGGARPWPSLRRSAGTITAADGRVVAEMTALCSVVPGHPPVAPPHVAAADGNGAADNGAADAGTADAGTAEHGAAAATRADPATGRGDGTHPLLTLLAATVSTDGDRTSVRFRPAAWLANPVGSVHGAAGCALADAAVSAALSRVLPVGSATQVMSMDVTFIRSIPLDAEVEATATVRHVGRRLAVVDSELGPAGAGPSVLARFLVARTTLR